MIHVVLVAHGSRDPRAAVTVRAIAQAVAVARPDVAVHDAYLDFDAPHLGSVLADLTGVPVIVVPLLLTSAYHARTDIPAIVAAARERGASIDVAAVLGDPDDTDSIVAALRRRLPSSDVDALVLAAAGTRDAAALTAIDRLATRLGCAAGAACIPGYASGAGRTMTEAVHALRATGARRIGIASYFLAPGVLHDRILASAAGVTAVQSNALGAAPEIIEIISRRIDAHALVTA